MKILIILSYNYIETTLKIIQKRRTVKDKKGGFVFLKSLTGGVHPKKKLFNPYKFKKNLS